MQDKKNQMIGFKTDAKTKERLSEIAEYEDRSISYVINKFVKEGIERYDKKKSNENEDALKGLDYLDKLEYASYEEFLKITMQNNTFNWLKEVLGEHIIYVIVCEQLGITPDKKTLIHLSEKDRKVF